MLEDLCRAILTKDNKKYEFVTFDADLPGEAQYQELKNNHKFDFCVKQSFKSSPRILMLLNYLIRFGIVYP